MPVSNFDVDAFLLKRERPRDRAVMDLLEFARREERRSYAPDLRKRSVNPTLARSGCVF
jgi:hypothetical protein